MINLNGVDVEPGLCVGLPASLDGFPFDHYWMEPKFDGVRILIGGDSNGIVAKTRAGQDVTAKLPVLRVFEPFLRNTILDAEVFAIAEGKVNFVRANATLNMLPDGAVERQKVEGPLLIAMFDVLFVEGQDVRDLAIEERRELASVIASAGGLELVPQFEASPTVHEQMVKAVREGSMLKRKGSRYPRGRGSQWIRWKEVAEEDVVMMGVTEGQGKYAGTAGAVIFGQWRDGELVERGQCSGMTDAMRDELWTMEPGRVMKVRHMGPLREGWRHPQFVGFRSDKLPEQCLWT